MAKDDKKPHAVMVRVQPNTALTVWHVLLCETMVVASFESGEDPKISAVRYAKELYTTLVPHCDAGFEILESSGSTLIGRDA